MGIHQNLSYYTGCYLKGIKVNMDNLGSVTTEKSHSINVVIIGKGISMLIVEQISALFRNINIFQGIKGGHMMNYILVQLIIHQIGRWWGGKKERMIFMPK